MRKAEHPTGAVPHLQPEIDDHSAACPLCGSSGATILASSSSTWLAECSACVGAGIAFWVTTQAGHRAEQGRGDGRRIDPTRARWLVDHRLHQGIPAYFQQADIDGLLVDS